MPEGHVALAETRRGSLNGIGKTGDGTRDSIQEHVCFEVATQRESDDTPPVAGK
jgi:hypothetical protein